MPYDYYSRVLCPLCEGGEMRAVNASLARCSRCGDSMGHDLYETLLAIRSLPEIGDTQALSSAARGRHGARPAQSLELQNWGLKGSILRISDKAYKAKFVC